MVNCRTIFPPAKARFIAPMKPRLVDEPPATGDWIYELKFDGIRLIAVKNGAKVNLISRNGNELAVTLSGNRCSHRARCRWVIA